MVENKQQLSFSKNCQIEFKLYWQKSKVTVSLKFRFDLYILVQQRKCILLKIFFSIKCYFQRQVIFCSLIFFVLNDIMYKMLFLPLLHQEELRTELKFDKFCEF